MSKKLRILPLQTEHIAEFDRILIVYDSRYSRFGEKTKSCPHVSISHLRVAYDSIKPGDYYATIGNNVTVPNVYAIYQVKYGFNINAHIGYEGEFQNLIKLRENKTIIPYYGYDIFDDANFANLVLEHEHNEIAKFANDLYDLELAKLKGITYFEQ